MKISDHGLATPHGLTTPTFGHAATDKVSESGTEQLAEGKQIKNIILILKKKSEIFRTSKIALCRMVRLHIGSI